MTSHKRGWALLLNTETGDTLTILDHCTAHRDPPPIRTYAAARRRAEYLNYDLGRTVWAAIHQDCAKSLGLKPVGLTDRAVWEAARSIQSD